MLQPQPKIDKNTVLEAHEKEPKRIHFATSHQNALNKNNKGVSFDTFNIPFGEGFLNLFPWEMFPNRHDRYHCHSFWRSISNDVEYREIEAWITKQKDIVFLRDCLFTSIAIDLNMSKPGQYTEIGQWENNAKKHQCSESINALISKVLETIAQFKLYNDADFVCAVPAHGVKTFDLPKEIAAGIITCLEKDDLTQHFSMPKPKAKIKTVRYEEKWDQWEQTGLTFNECLKDKRVILIDDKYQSGITIQFVASKLLEAGASAVLGLCLVKTLSDDDNQ